MAVETLVYQGINRAPTDYVGLQACEELINLRPTQGGLVPVKTFNPIFSNVPYEKVFIHHTTFGDKHIAIVKGSNAVYAKWIDPSTPVNLVEITGLDTAAKLQDVVDNLYYAAAGNIILFSVKAEVAGKFGNYAWTFKDGEYKGMDADAPNVTFTVNTPSVQTAQTDIPDINANTEKTDINSYIESGLNAVQENNPDLCLGPIIIATALKTKDGNTFWSGNWQIFDPIPTFAADDRFHVSATSGWDRGALYSALGYFTDHPSAYSLIPLTSSGTTGGIRHGGIGKITVPGTKVVLTFPKVTGWDEDTSIIESVEVYASKPLLFLDPTQAADGYLFVDGDNPTASIIVPPVEYEDMDLGGQLLYLQESIPMASLSNGPQTVNLSFGGNIQITEDTLDTDAGKTRRYGKLLSYNARFHYYDSLAEIKIDKPTFLTASTGNTGSVYLLVRYSDDNQSKVVYLGLTPNSFDYGQPPLFVVANSINITEVITYFQVGNQYCANITRMSPSSSYNYSVGTAQTGHAQFFVSDVSEYRQAINGGAKTGIYSSEPAAINVTEQYNPFVFRVEHSYLAPGNILDVQPQMAAVVDNSYGTDPLNVFTTRGLYALTQGSANVLYGAFVPVSNIVAEDGGLSTEMGTFFLGAGNLWLVAGRRVTLISDALSRGPNKYIRECDGYKRIAGDQDGLISTPQYDMTDQVSAVEFEIFCQGGKLAYNRFRDELYVSNASYAYTYVISIKYRQWFKLGYRLYQDEKGSTIGNIPVSGGLDIVDFSTENPGHVTVHMQSRPFSMAYRYSHIHRIVAMMRASLSVLDGNTQVDDLAVVSLYGSDDLQVWNLLAYAKRNGSTVTSGGTTTDVPLRISQIRTAPSSRSWRYYTVCIGGKVKTDAEIGPVLVDYEPVIRRIG